MPKSSICADVTSAGTPRPSSVQEKEVNMRKPVIALAASAGVFTVVAAGAASLTVTGFVPQFGTIGEACQAAAVTVTPHVKPVVYDAGIYMSVTSVSVSGISPNCIGQEISVSLSSDNGQSYDNTATAVIAGASAEVNFDYYSGAGYDPTAYALDITDIDVVIAGDVVPSNPV